LKAKLRNLGYPVPDGASAKELERARAIALPDELIEMYRQLNPADHVELKQRIWSIENAVVENTEAVPGCALSPHGYIVFASTMYGDAYCVDTNITTSAGHHPIALFCHEIIGEDDEIEKISSLRVEVASSLEDFLTQFTNGELSEEARLE
jgi:hypothetical protein